MTATVKRPPRGQMWVIHEPSDTVVGLFYANGKRVQRTLGTVIDLCYTAEGRLRPEDTSKRFIEIAWDEKAGELRAELERAHGPNRPIREVMGEWITTARALGKAPNTVRQHELMRDAYRDACGDHVAAESGPRQIEKLTVALRARGLSPDTVNVRLRSLKTFLRWAYARGDLDRVPPVQMVRTDRRLPRVPSADTLRALFERLARLHAETRHKGQKRAYLLHERFLRVLVGTGARSAEAFWLRWDQIDLERGQITVRKQERYTVKERREKVLPIPDSLLAYLKRQQALYPGEEYLLEHHKRDRDGNRRMAYASPGALTLAFRRHFEALGETRIKPLHSLRAWWITEAFAAGIDLTTIQRGAGHSSPLVTALYLANPDVHVREAAGIVGQSVEKLLKKKRAKREASQRQSSAR